MNWKAFKPIIIVIIFIISVFGISLYCINLFDKPIHEQTQTPNEQEQLNITARWQNGNMAVFHLNDTVRSDRQFIYIENHMNKSIDANKLMLTAVVSTDDVSVWITDGISYQYLFCYGKQRYYDSFFPIPPLNKTLSHKITMICIEVRSYYYPKENETYIGTIYMLNGSISLPFLVEIEGEKKGEIISAKKLNAHFDNNVYDFKDTVDENDAVLYAKSIGHKLIIQNPTNKTIKGLKLSLTNDGEEGLPDALEYQELTILAYYHPTSIRYDSWAWLYKETRRTIGYSNLTLQPIKPYGKLTIDIIVTINQCWDIFGDGWICECKLFLFSGNDYIEIPFTVMT